LDRRGCAIPETSEMKGLQSFLGVQRVALRRRLRNGKVSYST
jgi:hypothetical protein